MYNTSVFYTKERAEVRIYQDMQFEGFHHYSYGTHVNKISSRKKNNVRSKKNILNLVNANFHNINCLFLTLTFKENIKDLDLANKCFYSFIRKIRKINPNLAYICTIEFQKRGAIHYHILLKEITNVNYIDYLKKWRDSIKRSEVKVKGGSVRIQFIYNSDNVVNYISKYMSKKLAYKSLCGRKSYLTSKGLKKPSFSKYIIKTKTNTKNIKKYLPELKDMKLKKTSSYTDGYTQKNIDYMIFEKQK